MRHGGSKLTNEDVQLIRSLFKSRNTTTQKAAEQLAKLFGVSKTTITNIVYRYYWKEGDDQ